MLDMKVSPRTVLSQTVDKLRMAILSGHFKPGERLVEQVLCQKMSVSRTSVREALRRLEAERLVTIVPNKGPSVTVIDWAEAEEIYDVRALLEGEAAALSATRIRPNQLADMREALDDFDKAVAQEDPMGRVLATSRFYDAMLAACQNSVIRELLQGLVARINFLRARSMSRPGRARHSAIEMRRMLTAIGRKDPKRARAAAVEHIRAACTAARGVFESKKTA
jgi:DNA-binding GntR family transcriptional regulator